jgi:hypothetical protein
MNRKTSILTMSVLLAWWTVLPVLAQSGGGYDLTWSTTDGGGGASSGDVYSLGGTVGQPDAGLLTGGAYTLGGGFWGSGAATIEYRLYLPLVLRQ